MSLEQGRAERAAQYAETLSKQFQTGILKNVQDKPLWVFYKPEQDERGNIHKRPYTVKNYPASIYKPAQWASLDNVLEDLASGRFPVAGIGLMLPVPYVLLDIDV